MKQYVILIAMLLTLLTVPAQAADVTLEVTIPDAWVAAAIDAFNSTFPGRTEAGLTNKQWAEYWIRNWVRGIVAPYKTRMDREAAETAAGFAETDPDDIPITISGE